MSRFDVAPRRRTDDSGLLEAVVGAYGLVDAVVDERLGHWGRTIRARIRVAPDGAFLLKERPYYLRPAEFEATVRLHRGLAARGAPVTRPRRTCDKRLTAVVDGRVFALYEWIDGTHPAPAREQAHAEALGTALGRILGAAAEFRGDPGFAWDRPSFRFAHLPDDAAGVRRYSYHVDRRLRALGVAREPLAERIRREAERRLVEVAVDDLPQGIVHGDANPFNAIVDRFGNVRFADFDNARWTYRVWDLANLLASVGAIARDAESERAGVREGWDVATMAGILRGYATEQPLSASERRALTRLVPATVVAVAIGELDLDDDDFAPPANLGDEVERLHRLLETWDPSLIDAVDGR